MGEIGSGRLGDPVNLPADRRKTFLHPHDDALDLLSAFAGALGPQRGVAALADQAADLAVEIADGIADQVRGLARRFGEALHFAGDHRKTLAGGAGAGGLDGRVQRQQVGLPRDRLDRPGYLAHLGERGSDRAEPKLDAADGLDQPGDVLDRGFHRGARLGDFIDGRGCGRLHRLGCTGDVVVGGNHRHSGLLQMLEACGLAGNPAGDFLQVSGHVRKLDPKAADPVRKLIDQPFAVRGAGGGKFQFCGLNDRHRRSPPGQWNRCASRRWKAVILRACTPCGIRPSGGR